MGELDISLVTISLWLDQSFPFNAEQIGSAVEHVFVSISSSHRDRIPVRLRNKLLSATIALLFDRKSGRPMFRLARMYARYILPFIACTCVCIIEQRGNPAITNVPR